jgi:hypothetical protein
LRSRVEFYFTACVFWRCPARSYSVTWLTQHTATGYSVEEVLDLVVPSFAAIAPISGDISASPAVRHATLIVEKTLERISAVAAR